MIHRAILGSIERFMGVAIEHYAGAFPFWLAPVQCVLIPIAADQLEYCRDFLKVLELHGIRAEIDDRNESMGLKTREAQIKKIPMMLVAGGRELEAGTFSMRKYSEKASTTLSKDELLKIMAELEDAGHPEKKLLQR
jgi:threonyl-tRNA synthetase